MAGEYRIAKSCEPVAILRVLDDNTALCLRFSWRTTGYDLAYLELHRLVVTEPITHPGVQALLRAHVQIQQVAA